MVATGTRDPFEALRDFADFYYDTALSGSPTALPSLLAFAHPGHVLYGSDWSFAPAAAGTYFNSLLDSPRPSTTPPEWRSITPMSKTSSPGPP